MRLGADVRVLSALPVFVLVVPWHCSLVPPSQDLGQVGPSATQLERDPREPGPPPQDRGSGARRDEPIDPIATPPPRYTVPDGPSAVSAKREDPIERVSSPAMRSHGAVTLPDEVVVRTISAGQQLFLRCWERAQRKEPGPIPGKVRLHLELDEQGHVTAVQSDSKSAALSSCLAVVARQLPFPAPGQPAVVDLPLMFR